MIRFWLAGLALVTATLPFSAAALELGRDFVYVCEDGGNGAYEAFPDACRLKDGRLMCVFYAGWTHVSLPTDAQPAGGRVVAVYSSDEGRTWSPPQIVFDGPDDDRDPSIAQLQDGQLLCTFFSLRPAEAGEFIGMGSWVVASSDAGQTWQTPVPLSATYYVSSPARELKDGSLIVGLYRADSSDASGAVTISSDGGETWADPIDIPNGGVRLDAETDLIELKDGRLYAVQRSETETMRYSISADRGKTWSVSAPIGFPGHSPYLYRAPSDAILLAHRVPNTSLHYSLDDAKTWSDAVQVDEVNGAYPSFVTLKDGSTLIVYYEEGANSNIRARKFRMTPAGVQWLTW